MKKLIFAVMMFPAILHAGQLNYSTSELNTILASAQPAWAQLSITNGGTISTTITTGDNWYAVTNWQEMTGDSVSGIVTSTSNMVPASSGAYKVDASVSVSLSTGAPGIPIFQFTTNSVVLHGTIITRDVSASGRGSVTLSWRGHLDAGANLQLEASSNANGDVVDLSGGSFGMHRISQ